MEWYGEESAMECWRAVDTPDGATQPVAAAPGQRIRWRYSARCRSSNEQRSTSGVAKLTNVDDAIELLRIRAAKTKVD